MTQSLDNLKFENDDSINSCYFSAYSVDIFHHSSHYYICICMCPAKLLLNAKKSLQLFSFAHFHPRKSFSQSCRQQRRTLKQGTFIRQQQMLAHSPPLPLLWRVPSVLYNKYFYSKRGIRPIKFHTLSTVERIRFHFKLSKLTQRWVLPNSVAKCAIGIAYEVETMKHLHLKRKENLSYFWQKCR